MASAAPVLVYERGDTYVENIYAAESKDKEGKTVLGKDGKPLLSNKTAHGLVGTLSIGGYTFETLERMDGYVKLAPGDYPNSSMYVDTKRGKVVNPWLGAALEADKQYKNILIHAGQVPSHFEGCIGVGFLEGGKLTYSSESMEILWEQCGGTIAAQPIVTVRVVGAMPKFADCTKYAG